MSIFGKRHKRLTGNDAHTVIWREVDDAAARLALVLTEEDEGKIVKQTDDSSHWILDAYATATWVELTAVGVAAVTSVAGRTGDVVVTSADLADLGTAANEDVGTAVGDIPQLEDIGGGVPGLPAVDGSQLTGIAAGGSAISVHNESGTELTTDVTKFRFTGSVVVTEPVADEITVNVTPGAAPVASVFARTGAVTAQPDDYAASEVTNDATDANGNVTGAYVSDALDTADAAIEANTTAAAAAQSTANTANSTANAAKTKTDRLTVTQAVDLDQMEIDVAANNAKRSYPVADEAMVDSHEATLANVLTPITAPGAALLDDLTVGDQRTTLGLGSAAVENIPVDPNAPGIGDVATYVNVGGNAGLPAVDGSQLTNLPSGVTTFVALTDVDEPDYVGHAGEFVKVNATSDGLVFDTIPGGGDMLSTNNLSDVANALTATQNLGVEVGVDVAAQGHTHDTLANVASGVILGRDTAGVGNSEELTPTEARALLNVEDGATADQAGAEIKAAYEAEADTNAYTDADAAAVGALGNASTRTVGNQAINNLPQLTAEGTLPITDGVSTTTYYSDGLNSTGASVQGIFTDGSYESHLYVDSVEAKRLSNSARAGIYSTVTGPSVYIDDATYNTEYKPDGITSTSPTFSIKGRDLVADRVIIDANQTHATGNGSDHADVASNTAVRLTTDEHAAIDGADTPSASNVFITENDIGVAELSALMSDGPIAAFRIFADNTALQAAQGVSNQYGWRQSDTTLWRDSGSAWEQVGASGTETNDLETACANIALNEVPVGTSGGGAAVYRALSNGAVSYNTTTETFSQAGVGDLSGTPTGTGDIVLENSPTIVTPTIASMTNAQHSHADAAGGGQIAYSNLTGTPSPTPMKVFIESPTSGDVIILGRCDRAYTIASVYGVIDSGTSVVVSVASGASRATADQTNVSSQTVSSTTTGNSLTIANTGLGGTDWVWVTIGTVTGTVDGLNLTIAFS